LVVIQQQTLQPQKNLQDQQLKSFQDRGLAAGAMGTAQYVLLGGAGTSNRQLRFCWYTTGGATQQLHKNTMALLGQQEEI
jgi:hypothetical protein